jgi:hypothetical protein
VLLFLRLVRDTNLEVHMYVISSENKNRLIFLSNLVINGAFILYGDTLGVTIIFCPEIFFQFPTYPELSPLPFLRTKTVFVV